MEIDSAKECDKVFERDGAQLIVDKKSFLCLRKSFDQARNWLRFCTHSSTTAVRA
jgi:hypothetical protein